ncbi:MAG TPA: 2Fe-2S iron-sulfur cluster-binding protein, partial [Acidimicrobiales bacterium]|nr:2Fe-2S iron-sulfur cluster-binding protein [Acidimicrobiales bacterium]
MRVTGTHAGAMLSDASSVTAHLPNGRRVVTSGVAPGPGRHYQRRRSQGSPHRHLGTVRSRPRRLSARADGAGSPEGAADGVQRQRWPGGHSGDRQAASLGSAAVTLHFILNGEAVSAEAPDGALLLDVVRGLGRTGSKEGCSVGVCGLCTMLVGELPVSSCLYLAAMADGAEVWTVEGL